jgi:hypothetical protein
VNASNAAAPVLAAPPVTAPAHAVVQMVPLHTSPTPVEQEHIRQALEASQTSMDAIQTLLSLSQWVLAVLIAILALWGLRAVIWGSAKTAKQIANSRFDAYMETKEFRDLVEERLDKALDRRFQDTVVVRTLKEESAAAGDASEFPEAQN